jgi:hypothetical protein
MKMDNPWKTANRIVLGALVGICLIGTLNDMTFGWGLGDMFGYLTLYIATLMHLILSLALRRKASEVQLILTLIFTTVMVLTILMVTICRGHEYPWNGRLFYTACLHEIEIKNHGTEKTLQVQMCSMDYYSEFTGTWDGEYLTISHGSIEIPAELDRFIQKPILKVAIEPNYNEIIEQDYQRTKVFHLRTDTLQTEVTYELTGEVSGVRNLTPIMRVEIK